MSKSKSVGTKLFINNVAVGGLTSINGIEISADDIDVTDLGNEDGYKESLPGFKDAGEVSSDGYLDGEDNGQEECLKLMDSGEVVPCEIRFPPKIGKSWTFKAGVTGFSTSAAVEDAVGFSLTLKVSGKPTLAATKTDPAPAG